MKPFAEVTPFEEKIHQYLCWVKGTFQGETVEGQIEHFMEEVKELSDGGFSDPSEFADVFMLLTCIAEARGFDLLIEFEEKFRVCRERKWEKTERGWRHIKPDNNAI